MRLSDQQVQIIVGGVVAIITTFFGYLLKRGQREQAEAVVETAKHVKGEVIQQAATVKARQDVTDRKVERIDQAVNGISLTRDRKLEQKSKENRVLYGEIQKLREALVAAGVQPPTSELRVSPAEEERAP